MRRTAVAKTALAVALLVAAGVGGYALGRSGWDPFGGEDSTGTADARPGTYTLLAKADAYVEARSAEENFGGDDKLRVDAAPVVLSYLRFDLSSIQGPISKATLQLYANSQSTEGYGVRRAMSSSWTELRITYANRPSLSTVPAAFSGEIDARAWSLVDVTTLARSAGAQQLTLVLDDRSTAAISFASRENEERAPRLVVVVGQTTTAASADPARRLALVSRRDQ